MIEHVELPLEAESISLRAYLRFLDRGCEDGYDLEDWLLAEADVRGELSPYDGDKEHAHSETEPVLAESSVA
jgi:hypothetical protein